MKEAWGINAIGNENVTGKETCQWVVGLETGWKT